jgi:import inner membrane translocase subunit TIM8
MDKLLENDPELARFVAQMEQTARLKQMADKLTHDCWDVCVSSANVSKFDSRTESCLVNCVDRFIDTSSFIVEGFSKLGQKVASGGESSFSGLGSYSGSTAASFSSEPEMILDDTTGTQPRPSAEPKKKGGWW